MKKLMLYVIGFVVVVLALLYILLFTPIGNHLLKPLVQSQINKYSPIELEVQKFSLGFSNFDVLLRHQDVLLADFKGNFSVFSQNIDAQSNITLQNISTLSQSSQAQNDTFKINATINGKFQDFLLVAKSNIADSKTQIQANFKHLSLSNLKGDIQNLKLQALLPILNQKAYANGLMQIHIDVEQAQNKTYAGKIAATFEDGFINQALVQNDFKITIPKTIFSLNLQADIQDNLIKDNFTLTSNIGNLSTSGSVGIPDLRLTHTYEINFSDLSPLTPFVKMPLRGTFKSKGDIAGNREALSIAGKTDVANSQSEYNLSLKNFELQKVGFDVKKISLNKILWMLYQPEYVTGYGDFEGSMGDFKNGISLKATSHIDGKILNTPMKKFNIDMPDTPFKAQINAIAKNGVGKLDVGFEARLARLKIQQADFNIPEAIFDGKYSLYLPDLRQLKPIVGMNLAGAFEIDGRLGYSKGLRVDFHSKSLGGNLAGVFENNRIESDFKDVGVKNILNTLQIPQVFDAFASGSLDYDILSQKGKILASIQKGTIAPSDFTNMLKKYTQFDITKEIFDTATFSSTIDKKLLDTQLDFASKQVRIQSNDTKIDLGKNKISSHIKLSLKDDSIRLNLSGNLNAPNVAIDASDLIKKQTIEAIHKGSKDAIEKYVPKEQQQQVKKLLDGVLKGF